MAKSSAARQERVQRSRDREAILESVRKPARQAAPADLDRLIHEHVRLGIVRDRKSTRLNSSHGYISYAVFCLKKKKTTNRTTTFMTTSIDDAMSLAYLTT